MSSSASELSDTMRVVGQVYPWDLAGDPGRAARWREFGVDAVSIAMLYHEVRAITWTGGDVPSVVMQPGATYVPVDDPMLSGAPAGLPDDIGLRAVEAARSTGLEPIAWLSLTHRDGMNELQRRFAARNPWGERSTYALCPSFPEVRAAGIGLIRTVHRLGGVTAFQVEALGALGFEHGVAHDKADFAWLGRRTRRALSACCCEGCTALAGEHGLDLDAAAAALRRSVAADPDGEDTDAFEVTDRVRRLATAVHARELDALARSAGFDITVAVGSDPTNSGPFAAVDALPSGLHPYTLLDDRSVWDIPGRSGAVLEMRPSVDVRDALAGQPFQALDDLYLYHLGTRRPDTIDPETIRDVRREHGLRREAA